MAGLKYIKSFDGIRGFFAIVIVVAHWSLALPFFPLGWEGLQLFFLISGFLITRILLHEKERTRRLGPYLKNFYIKRTFRIFPLYFLYIFFVVALMFLFKNNDIMTDNIAEFSKNWKYYLTYTNNLKFWVNFKMGIPYNDSPFFAHLWTLALEEQFYFFMPMLVFFLSKRKLAVALGILIIAPIFIRFFGYQYLTAQNDDPVWAILIIYRNLIFQADSFALGAALAAFNFDWIKHPKRWFYFLLAVFVTINVASYPAVQNNIGIILDHLPGSFDNVEINPISYLVLLGHPELLLFNYQYVYTITLVNLMGFLIALTAVRNTSLLPKVLQNKWMIKVGKVSYGFYVFHFLGIVVITTIAGKFFGGVKNIHLLVQIPLFIVFIIGLYYFSLLLFNYFEKPFLKLREKFVTKTK